MPNWTVRNFPRPGQLDPSQSVGTMAPGGGGRFAGMRPQLDPSQSVGTAVSGGEGREGITHPGVAPRTYDPNTAPRTYDPNTAPRTYDPNAAPPAGLIRPNAPMMGGQSPNLGWRPQGGSGPMMVSGVPETYGSFTPDQSSPNLGWRPQGGGSQRADYYRGGGSPDRGDAIGKVIPSPSELSDMRAREGLAQPSYGAGGADDPYRPLMDLLRQRLQPRGQGQQGELIQMIMSLLNGQG